MRVGWRSVVSAAGLCLSALTSCGCSEPPKEYRLAQERYLEAQIAFPNADPQIERGRPIAVLDGLNHYVLSLPTKLLFWNWHLLDHRMEPNGEALLRRYLDLNGMTAVKIRHNQYAPLDEFRRLRQNTEVGAGYRYTFGVFALIRYTLLPDRLLAGLPVIGGGDHFNPFSNSINVYSSDPAVLLHEGGHAKDYLNRRLKGTTFILPRLLPGWEFYQEATASADAIRFLHCVREPSHEVAAYGTLWPAYASYIGARLGLIAYVPAIVSGHVAGNAQGRKRRNAQQTPEEQLDLQQLPEFCVADGGALPAAPAPTPEPAP